MFFFERYNNHLKSEHLIRELRPVLKLKINQLHELKSYPHQELEFLNTAAEEVVKCR